MKKWFKLLMMFALAALVAIGSFGCVGTGNPADDSSEGPEIDPNQQVTLKIQSAAPLKYNYNALLQDTDPSDPIYKQALFTKELVENFKEQYPNIKLQFIENGWGDALYQQNSLYVRNWLQGGEMAVDIMIGETYMGYFAKNGVFAELDNSMFAEVLEGSYADMVVDGKIYGVPMCTGIVGLQYNKAILAEAGIAEEDMEPATWDELLANCKKVSEYAAANNKDYDGIILNNVSGMSSAFRALPFMRQAGGDFYDENGNLALNSAANVKAYEYLRELAAYTPDGSLNETSEDTLQSLFLLRDRSAYYIDGQWAMTAADENFSSCALPKTDAEDTKVGNCFLGNVIFAITEGSSNKAAAQAFLSYLTSAEVQMRLYELDGRLPVNKTALESKEIREINPVMNPYIDMLLAGGFEGALPHFETNSSLIWEAWGSFYKSVLTGTDAVQTLADSLNAKILELLAE